MKNKTEICPYCKQRPIKRIGWLTCGDRACKKTRQKETNDMRKDNNNYLLNRLRVEQGLSPISQKEQRDNFHSLYGSK